MLFNSYVFLFIFLPLVLIAWWVPKKLTIRLGLLVLASYFFYGWWDWRFCAMMFLVTCTDYLVGALIHRTENQHKRNALLVVTLVVNLGLLGYFKYAGFFTRTAHDLVGILNFDTPVIKVLLPLGISFYIFESLSYTIDIYRHITKPAKSFLHYMLFISIFPKLIAGPIIRYTDIEEQYAAIPRRLDATMMWSGVLFFVIGLVKKLVIADQASALSAPFMALGHPGFFESWLAIGGYTLRIYFDFSGYSDMAVGLGMMLGFRFPRNFNRPYLATNPTEFWDRWHITLSRWLRDYLFIPLGGSRRGTLFTARNLFIVMFLGGLWHGADWTFVVWGLYHGLLLAVYHTWRHLRGQRPAVVTNVWVARGFTLLAVMVGWAFFASPSIGHAFGIIEGMFGLHGVGSVRLAQLAVDGELVPIDPRLTFLSYQLRLGLCALAGILWVRFLPEVWEYGARFVPTRRFAIATALLAVVAIGSISQLSPFIYYQF